MKIFLAALFTFVSVSAFAQAAPTDKFRFNMTAPSLAVAQAYRYDLELDNVVLPTALVTTCSQTTDITCDAPIPAITPTTHVARVRAVDVSGSTPIVGPFSDPLTFTMRATPGKPTGLTIVSGDAQIAGLIFDLGSVPLPMQQ